ncbi:hypothetical protein F2Q69_00043228 [Brassica cretica]|uniref:Uncharacterized protein n=1 Tax=Brassica cretica TaxID=69181 RepID=A0A8S9NTX0_BRACR|nr:hypothetical protein F2Q69_00043228 [Brassica cretica]
MPRDARDQCAGFRARPRCLRRLAMLKTDFFFRMPCFVLKMFADLKMFRDIGRDVFTQIAKDVVGQGLDHGTLTFKDVFTQIAKDVVGQGLDHGTLTFKAKFARVIRVKMADSLRKRFYALGRRSLRGLLHNHCGISCGMTTISDVTEGKERQKPASRRAKKMRSIRS